MSLRSTAHVAPKPLKGGGAQKRFRCNSALISKKVYTVSLCENRQRKSCKAYLSVQNWLVGEVPFYVKIWPKLTHSLQKRRFPINNRS